MPALTRPLAPRTAALLGLVVAGGLTAVAPAELIMIDVANTLNNDLLGDPDNVALTLAVDPGLRIVGVGLDANITTFGTSLVSQAGVFVGDAGSLIGVNLEGLGPNTPGDGLDVSTFGVLPVAFLGSDPIPVSSNEILIEFYETFDDLPGGADSIWNTGTLVIDVQPIPASGAFPLLGLGLLTGRRRRGGA